MAMHVALTFDDNFWAPAYALMRSICLSTRQNKDLVFHLLHFPLTEAHRQDLERIRAEFGAQLRFYPLDRSERFGSFVAGLPASTQWPKVVYARLLLTELLPDDIERVIYLDCDMMVRRPIEQLYHADLAGQPLAAVPEALAPFIMGRRDMRFDSDIFNIGDAYFNSGMLLIALEKWRDMDLRAQVAALAEKGLLGKLGYFDQDLLNIIFRERWTALDWRWNTIDAHRAHEALNPAILHYTSVNKPWALLAGIRRNPAYARWYRHVMTNEIFYRFARHRWKRWWKRLLRLNR